MFVKYSKGETFLGRDPSIIPSFERLHDNTIGSVDHPNEIDNTLKMVESTILLIGLDHLTNKGGRNWELCRQISSQ